MSGKPDKLTPRAERVLVYAREEAERLRHNSIGAEHLLLGIIKLGQGVAVTALQKQKADIGAIGAEIEKMVGLGPEATMISDPPFAARAKRVLVLARKQARTFQHTYVGTESLLLGLLREGKGPAAIVLEKHGVEFDRTRREVLKALGSSGVAPGHRGCLFAWCWWI